MAKPVSLERIAQMAARWLAPGIVEGLGPSPWSVPPQALTQSSVTADEDAHIDMKVLALAIASDDPEAHLRLLGMFRDAYVENQVRIDQAVDRGDHASLREAAHAATGAAANVGAAPLSLALKELELSAAGEDRKMINEHHVRAQNLGRDVLRVIEAMEADA